MTGVAPTAFGGIWFPGLIACGSRIQPARWPREFGNVAAARVARLARWVKSGPTLPIAAVPRMVWHNTHWWDMNTGAAAQAGIRLWFAGRRALRVEPLRKVGVRLGDDVERHMGVLPSAEFGALATIRPGPVRLQPDRG